MLIRDTTHVSWKVHSYGFASMLIQIYWQKAISSVRAITANIVERKNLRERHSQNGGGFESVASTR